MTLIVIIMWSSISDLLQVMWGFIQFEMNECGLICSEMITCCCQNQYLETFSLHMERATWARQLFLLIPLNSCFARLHQILIALTRQCSPLVCVDCVCITGYLFLSGSCGVTGGRLEGCLPHGLLLQSKPGPVDTQPSCQPACTSDSETGE